MFGRLGGWGSLLVEDREREKKREGDVGGADALYSYSTPGVRQLVFFLKNKK